MYEVGGARVWFRKKNIALNFLSYHPSYTDAPADTTLKAHAAPWHVTPTEARKGYGPLYYVYVLAKEVNTDEGSYLLNL